MSVQTASIERALPLDHVAPASALLRDVWSPPCLDYTPDYVRFHVTFPTSLDPIAMIAAGPDGDLGAFVAATGRRTSVGEIYLSSFLAVRPEMATALPVALVRQEARLIRKTSQPLLVFAQSGSTGESMLACVDSVGLQRQPLGRYVVHAAVAKPMPADLAVIDLDPAEWAEEARRLTPPGILTYAFDPDTMTHLSSGPERRSFLAVTSGGDVVGLAMMGVSRSVTATGRHESTVLHCLRVAQNRSDALTGLIAGAAQRTSVPSNVVAVPNVASLEPGLARSAGLRATPSVFSGYLFTSDGNDLGVRLTDLEIV